MKPEDKELLLKDISRRLFYGVKVTTVNPAVELGVISGISVEGKISVRTKHADIVFDCTEVRPYLRSMSSMTEEEKFSYYKTQWEYQADYCAPEYFDGLESYDWLNENMFDYRGLIEKGLAIEVTDENNPYKEIVL